jgi:chloramphenicol O-acetyltransferase
MELWLTHTILKSTSSSIFYTYYYHVSQLIPNLLRFRRTWQEGYLVYLTDGPSTFKWHHDYEEVGLTVLQLCEAG